MSARNGHLNEEQIIDAVIDEGGLKEEQRRHLETCTVCREEKADLKLKLDRLGQMAADYTPEPQTSPSISVPESRFLTFRRMAFATGFAAAVIVALIWGPAFFSDPGIQEVAVVSGEEEIDVFLVEDILEESALPDHYLEMAASSSSYFDEEFMDLVIPSEEYDDSV